jgi:iron complex outermembrane receptor protein
MLHPILIKRVLLLLSLAATAVCAQSSAPPATQNPATPQSPTTPPKLPTIHERTEVTVTRLPEDPMVVPTAIEVFLGDELRTRGFRDLRGALAFAIGAEIAPGGDAGPASAVPDFWGLKEFDAFLLVVDGVPWGGAFNPALTSLDLNDIERIEVLRGPAPVTYGATSFVGVIQIIHKDTASRDRTLSLRGGSFGTGGFSYSTPVNLSGRWTSRLSIDAQREGFSDSRTSFRRGHGVWRVEHKSENGNRFWFNFNFNWLDQSPASPRLREGAVLSPNVPVDANHNPDGAYLNDHRVTGSIGFDRRVAGGLWSTIASVSHSRQYSLRGFLEDPEAEGDNARGLRENIFLTDFYADSHISWKLPHTVTLLAGADYIHGTGSARGADFSYEVPVNGQMPVFVMPPGDTELNFRISDHRDFWGFYSSVEWRPWERLRIDGGVRLNVTHESRRNIDGGAGTSEFDTQTNTRVSGSIGAIYTAWQHDQDSLGLYVNYRDTFKPAAIDFGIGETEGGELILKPENSRSVEGGLKGRFFNRRVELEASGFLMCFTNLVTPVSIDGLPALINAGNSRFKGFESGASFYFPGDVIARATYSFHDARFVDFVQEFDGVPIQLGGNRLEMSARHSAAFGVSYAPSSGFMAGFTVNYTGSRFLNKRNTSLAAGFATYGAMAGYRKGRWELRVDATNLGNRRDPVAESELGDAQYYLMTARRLEGGLILHF